MKKINDDQIVVTDQDGKEFVMSILFTYDNDERGTKYVFFYDSSNEEEVMVMRYTDDDELFEIEDDDEFNETQEVFDAFLNDEKIAEAKKNK